MYIYKYQNNDESHIINNHSKNSICNRSSNTNNTNNDDIKVQKKIIFILDKDTENYINDDTKYLNNIHFTRSRRTSEHAKKSTYKRNNLLKYNEDILTRTYSNENKSGLYNRRSSRNSVTNDNVIAGPPLALFPEDNGIIDNNNNNVIVFQQIKRRNVKAPTTTIRERIGAFRATSLYANLIKEFSKAININQYVNNINCPFMPKINDGTLERINLPEMRNLIHLSANGFRTSSRMFRDDLNDLLGEGKGGKVVLFGKIKCGEFMLVNMQVVGFILGFLGILIYCLHILFSMY